MGRPMNREDIETLLKDIITARKVKQFLVRQGRGSIL